MAIQFCCSQCGQPIEVDDHHAGQTAACPYCRQVVAVPVESTYRPGAAVPPPPAPAGAWPTSASESGAGVPPVAGPHVAPLEYVPVPPERQRAAARYGNYSLVCAGLTVLILLGVIGYSMVLGFQQLSRAQGQPVSIDQVAKQFQNTPEAVGILCGEVGLVLCALAGTALAIVSLSQSRRDNWRGWTGLVICGGALLCFCGIFALGMIAMSLGGVKV